MPLETVIQNEVSQKEKNKYHILTFLSIYVESRKKNGVDNLICKAEIETWMQRTNLWILREGREQWDELVLIYVYYDV